MKKLIVIDHSCETVTVYPYDENVWECPEDYTTQDGVYVINNDCTWIVVSEVNIKIV